MRSYTLSFLLLFASCSFCYSEGSFRDNVTIIANGQTHQHISSSPLGIAAARLLAPMVIPSYNAVEGVVDSLSSTLKGLFPLKSWHHPQAPRRSLMDVQAECAGQSFEHCRAVVTQELYLACGADHAISNIDYQNHLQAGHRGFLTGLSGVTGSTNYIEQLIIGNDLSGDGVQEWGIDYVKQFWFWYAFLLVAILFVVFLCFWSPALCSRKYRGCLGMCFCRKCCIERERPYLFVEIPKKQAKKLLHFILFFFAWTLAFAITAIVYGIYLGSGTRSMECTTWRTTYGMLFGDTAYTSPHTWSGLMGVDGSFLDYADGLEIVNANLTVQEGAIRTYGPGTVDKALQEITFFEEHLNETGYRFATERGIFDSYGPIPNVNYAFYAPSHQQCLSCTLSSNTKIDTTTIEANLTTYVTTSADAIVQFQTEVMEPLLAEVPNVSDKIGMESISNAVLDAAGTLSGSLAPVMEYASYGLYAVFILVPIIAIVLWVVALTVIYDLAMKYKRREEPSMKKKRNWFACLCCAFATLTACLLLAGIVLMTMVQPASEGCTWIEFDLFHDNSYNQYDLFRGLVSQPDFDRVTSTCGTYGGDWQLVDAVTGIIPEVDDMPGVDEAIRDLATELNNTLDATIVNAQLEEFDVLDGNLTAANYLMHTSVEPKFLDPSEEDFEPRMYAMFKEFLYGGLQFEDVPVDAYTEPIFLEIQATAQVAIENEFTEFKVEEFSAADIGKTFFTQEIEIDPSYFYGMSSQEARLNEALVQIGCDRHSVCFNMGSVDDCCTNATTELCTPFDGLTTVIIEPSLNTTTNTELRNKLWIFESCENTANDGALRPVLQCILGQVRDTPNDGSVTSTAVLFINSLYFANFRLRSYNGDYLFTMFDSDDSSITWLTYDDYVLRTDENWRRIYSLGIIRDAMDTVLNALYAIADDAEYYYDVIKSELQCKLLFDSIVGTKGYLCEELSADFGMSGLWWVMMALGLFLAMILMWWIYRYFADRHAEDTDDYNNRDTLKSWDQIFLYCKQGWNRGVRKCCRFQDPNLARDPNQNGCLHIAAHFGHPSTCQLLLDKGCDPSIKNDLGYTPVDTGAAAGYPKVVTVLINGGANLRHIDPFGDMPIHHAARQGDESVLDALIPGEKPERFRGAPFNLDDETPQQAAATRSRDEIKNFLYAFYSGRMSRVDKNVLIKMLTTMKSISEGSSSSSESSSGSLFGDEPLRVPPVPPMALELEKESFPIVSKTRSVKSGKSVRIVVD